MANRSGLERRPPRRPVFGAARAIQLGSGPSHPGGLRRGATWQIGMGGEDFAGRARFSRVIDLFGRFHDKNVRTHEMSNGTANR